MRSSFGAAYNSLTCYRTKFWPFPCRTAQIKAHARSISGYIKSRKVTHDLNHSQQVDTLMQSEQLLDTARAAEHSSSEPDSALLNNLLKRHNPRIATAQTAPEAILEQQVFQLHAQLVARHEEGVFTAKVSDGQELFPVKKAFSCLHEALVGDQVLVSGSIRDGFYILAIIERPVSAMPTESVQETVLQLGKHVRLEAEHVTLKAQSHQLSVQHFQVAAHQYQVDSTQVTYRGQTMQYYAAQLDENYAQTQRFVAGNETVHALNFEYSAQQTARIHGVNTFINGEKLLKSDGQLMMVG